MTRKGCLLVALALAASGCLTPLPRVDEEPHRPVPAQAAPAPEPPPVVTADEVTETNAVEKARALSRELDFAETERPGEAPTPPAKESATKP